MEPGFLSLIHESSPLFSKASNVRAEVFCQEKSGLLKLQHMVKALLIWVLSLRCLRKGRIVPACSGMTHVNKGLKEVQAFNICDHVPFY